MLLRRMFILLTLGCLICATALAATPDYATLGVTNGHLYAGAHVGYIYQAFGGRGIGPTYLLNFAHSRQGDTEDLYGPYHLVTTITHTSPITAPDAVKLHYRYTLNGVAQPALAMTTAGGSPLEFSYTGYGSAP